MAKAPVTIEENKRSPRPNYDKPTVSYVRPTPPEVSLIYDNVQIFEKSTIKLDREVYSRKGFNENVGVEFEELRKKEDNFSPTQFFQLYDSLFFDIPKIGKNSHANLINRSRQYLQGIDTQNPSDKIINDLNDRIIELEQELLQNNQLDPEHPFFRNGTLVAEEVNGERTGKFYYMDKGYKRKVDYTDSFYKTLLKVLGYETSDDYPGASRNILSQIKTGPNLGENNFEQPTSIEDGEMYVGENITDNTKDAQINNLRDQLRAIKSGDFSNAPELEAFVVDSDEAQTIIGTIGTSVADELNTIYETEFGSSYIASYGRLVKQNEIIAIFNKILDKVVDKSGTAIQGYIYNS